MDTGEPINLHRIEFCLDVEDPRKYVKRIANALKLRNISDSLIKYNYLIDSMPIEDQVEMDNNQKKRIEMLVRVVKSFSHTDITPLLLEVFYDYQRIMNKIIFD